MWFQKLTRSSEKNLQSPTSLLDGLVVLHVYWDCCSYVVVMNLLLILYTLNLSDIFKVPHSSHKNDI